MITRFLRDSVTPPVPSPTDPCSVLVCWKSGWSAYMMSGLLFSNSCWNVRAKRSYQRSVMRATSSMDSS